MRIEAGAGLSCMQSGSKFWGAILQEMRYGHHSASTSVDQEIA